MTFARLRAFCVPILGIALLAFGGGCHRRYQFTTVCDYAVLEGQLYILVLHEAGIDKASRFAHSADFAPAKHVLCIAKSGISRNGENTLEVVAKGETQTEEFLRIRTYQLCSTNSIIVGTRYTKSQIMTLGTVRESSFTPKNFPLPRMLPTNTVFSAGREWLLGCGLTNNIINTRTSEVAAEDKHSKLLSILCHHLGLEPTTKAAVSQEGSTLAFQNALSDARQVRLVSVDGFSTNDIVLPEYGYALYSIHDFESQTRILFSHLAEDARKSAVLINRDGRELGRSEIFGEPAADAACRIIVAVSSTQAIQLNKGERLSAKVWLPNEQLEFTVSLDTAKIFAACEN